MSTRRTLNRSTRIVAVAAALCTAAVVLPGTAMAEDGDEEQRGQYEVASDAKSVKGTASSTDAPELADPGYFTDTIGRGEEKYYRVDLDSTSTAYLSALAHPKSGTKVASSDGLEVTLQSTGGETCGSVGKASFASDEVAYPIGDFAPRRVGGDQTTCQSADSYLFKVVRDDEPTSDPGEWPIEIRYMLEPGLKGSLPAPPAEGSWSTEAPAPPSGEAKKVTGGAGITSAPAVGDGVWRDRVMPGETRFYRVPIDWGQQLFARAELPNGDAKNTEATSVSAAFGLHLFTPSGAAVISNNFKRYDGKQNAARLGGRPVEYGNRFGTKGRAVSTAGFYTMALTLSPDLEQYFPRGANLTLRVTVKGTAKEAPEYDGDAEAAGFAVTDEDREAAEKGQTADDISESGSLRLVGMIGIAVGVALVLGLGLWMLVARRRGATPAPAAPDGYPQRGDGPEGQPGGPAGGQPGGNGNWQ